MLRRKLDTKELQTELIRLRLLDPPVDGIFGVQTKNALKHAQALLKLPVTGEITDKCLSLIQESKELVPVKLTNSLASRIVKYFLQEGYHFCVIPDAYTIVYLEGCSWDGTPNDDKLDGWNDRRIILKFDDGHPVITGNFLASCEPGKYYTWHPLHPSGAARIEFGQYRAWRVGTHGWGTAEPHEALVQVAPITVRRDKNKDGYRTGDAADTGLFGINQHHGYNLPSVGRASAGCLVGQMREGHAQFMRMVKSDARYKLNRGYTFFTTVIDSTKL